MSRTLIEQLAEGAARGAASEFAAQAEAIEQREKAYRDRNLLALAFIAEYAAEGRDRVGTYDHGGDEWAVVYAELNIGQVSWHVPEEIVPEWIPERHPEVYDGHDRSEKNARLAETYGLHGDRDE